MDMKPHILVVDNKPLNIDMIVALLSDQDYDITTANNGASAWQTLISSPDKFDVILVDKMMPGMNGLELIVKMKQRTELHSTVILLTESAEDLDGGAQYYISKPLEEKTLISTVKTAIRHQISYKHRVKNKIALSLVNTAEFRFKTLQQAHALAALLSEIYPDPSNVITGLTELMINAVEHGNLAIDYAGKSALMAQGILDQEIQRRLQLPDYKDRYVTVALQLLETQIELTVIDQGGGFDWQKYMEFDMTRLLEPHGRGIAISNKLSFSELEYKGIGNEVVARLHL